MTDIILIKLSDRDNLSNRFQEIISAYGCYIKTRIGLHDTETDICSSDGIIILQMVNSRGIIKDLLKELHSIKNIQLKNITLN